MVKDLDRPGNEFKPHEMTIKRLFTLPRFQMTDLTTVWNEERVCEILLQVIELLELLISAKPHLSSSSRAQE